MPVPTYDVSERPTRLGREVSVMLCSPAPLSGTAGTPISFLGVWETFEIELKREFTDTTGSSDTGPTSRAKMWGKGSVKLGAFVRGTTSAAATLFASGSHTILQFQEVATGDQWQLMCTNETYSKTLGKNGDANKDSLTLPTEGTPYYGAAGATPTALPLEA